MMDSIVPPGSGPSSTQGPNAPEPIPPQDNVFAKMFPTAAPDQIKKIVTNFINFTISQMKQDQDNMLQALKQMQQDEDQ